MEAKPVVVNPKLVKELGVFSGLKANVCSQRFNRDLSSGTSVTSKKGKYLHKVLKPSQKIIFNNRERELMGQGKGPV